MWSAIKEIVSYVLFLAIVSFIAWGTKNDTVYRMNAAIGALYKGANKTYNATNVSVKCPLSETVVEIVVVIVVVVVVI